MAAICVLGQICDGPVAEKFHTTILHMCAKLHAFITKGTIYFYICCTKRGWSDGTARQQKFRASVMIDATAVGIYAR